MLNSTTALSASAAVLVLALAVQSKPTDPARPIQGTSLLQSLVKLESKALDGSRVSAPMERAKATVIALTSTTCPLSLRYGPTLARMEKEYSAKGVKFIFVNSVDSDPVGDMHKRAKLLGLSGPYISELSATWQAALHPRTTTEAFVLDSKGKIVYRGAVDDQYAIGAALPAPRNRYLALGIDAALTGKAPKVAETHAPGCLLETNIDISVEVPTFHGRIQHIIQKSCLPCHRPGGVAPFSLESYEDVKARAKMLKFVVEGGIMPPWFAAKGSGPWKNDMSLPDADRADLFAWIDAGAPKGDPKDSPSPAKFESGWTIGRPDVTFQLPKPIEIPASGIMQYQNVVVPTGFTEDKWVQKIEVMPGDRRVVHHILVFIRKAGENARTSRISDTAEEISGFFGIYVPGNSSLIYPEGYAKQIPKGASLKFQIHYTPNGTATTDQSKIGFIFSKEPPKVEVHTASVVNVAFMIPPGAPNHEVVANLTVPMDVQILSYLPHMHVRAKAARYELTAGGKTQTLLDVPRYDFNWQLNYVLAKPLSVKAGDKMTFRAWYDNSDQNPNNPDPKKTVRWGSQTFDEMHLGYIEYIVPGEKPGEGGGIRRQRPGAGGRGQIEAAFKRLDRNQDGFLTESEAPALWIRLKSGDKNQDNKISLEEALMVFGG